MGSMVQIPYVMKQLGAYVILITLETNIDAHVLCAVDAYYRLEVV